MFPSLTKGEIEGVGGVLLGIGKTIALPIRSVDPSLLRRGMMFVFGSHLTSRLCAS